MAAIVGDLAAAEEIKALKDLMDAWASPHRDCRQDGAKLATVPRQSYLFNTSIAGIDAADALLLIGTNLRWEAPVLNARVRRHWLAGKFEMANVGVPMILATRCSSWARRRISCARLPTARILSRMY